MMLKRLTIMGSALCIGLMAHAARANERLLAAEMAPFSYSHGGEAAGFAVDIATELSARLDVRKKIEVMPIARAIATSTTGKNALIIAIARTPEREKLLRWIVKIKVEPLVLLVKADSKLDISTIEISKALRIGVLRQGAAEHAARRLEFGSLEVSSEDVSIVRKLILGRIDAWLTGVHVAMVTMDRAGLDRSSVRAGPKLGAIDIYVAGSLAISDDTAAKWKGAFNDLVRDGTYQKILDKHQLSN